ncbi:SPRY domain-containing protein 3-like [Diadema setosum]|uniref:SPRY domain-containing protein 3-like n=1 Tax=Diadema setosum TaxID=31175 RepID=UPI003B3A1656
MDPRMDPRRRRRRLADNGEDLFAQLLGRRPLLMPRAIGANRAQGLLIGRPFPQRNGGMPAAFAIPRPLQFRQQDDLPGDVGDIRFIKNQACVMLSHNGRERSFGHAGVNKKPGVCIAVVELTEEENFFEVEIKGTGRESEELRVGMATEDHPTDIHLGATKTSVGFSVFEGKGHFHTPDKMVYPPAKANDRVGIALHFEKAEYLDEEAGTLTCPLSVVLNGKKILQQEITLPEQPFHPAFSLGGRGQSVKFVGLSRWTGQEEDMLIDDVGEEQVWRRINHVSMNGQLLTYTGRGEDYSEFGMAQGRKPLGPANHYFEVEIVDPGRSCYVALGVTRKDYPVNMHPGWDRGSIAYHADDGKIFTGHGIGNPFGPKCHKGDIMGCGIMFPRDYQADSDEDSDGEEEAVDQWRPGNPNPNRLEGPGHFGQDNFGVDIYDFREDGGDEDGGDDDASDEDWEVGPLGDGRQKATPTKVQVFFTRNGTTIGRRENVSIPPGGFYPTVGMLSPEEKVRVDLQPLSG